MTRLHLLLLLCVFCPTGAVGKQPYREDAVAWQESEKYFFHGSHRADAFRRQLLAEDEGTSTARLIAYATRPFVEACASKLPSLRPNVDGFDMKPQQMLDQIAAKRPIPAAAAFADFSGRWYGTWDHLQVDHHWHPTVRGPWRSQGATDNAPTLNQFGDVLGYQYAWIGNGFAWNYLTRPDGRRGDAVLGYVWILKPNQPRGIESEFPLVGIVPGDRKLIWITAREVFYEQVLPAKEAEDTRYAITGFRYSIADGRLQASDAFQAVYTRKPDDRPEFLRFKVNLNVGN